MAKKMDSRVNRALILMVVMGVFVALLAFAGGCASKSPAPSKNEPPAKGNVDENFVWSADADCGACHKTEQDSAKAASMTASAHNAKGVTCLGCHSDDQKLADAHKDVDASSKTPTRLRLTSIPDETCLGCHESNHTDRAALAALTTESKALTDSKGTVVNPHSLPQNEDHNIIKCGSCHSMHTSTPVGENAKKACLNCHHADVFECGTCHEV